MENVISYYWTTSTCRSVCVAAVGFGYGPRNAAHALAHTLHLNLNQWKTDYDPISDELRRCSVFMNFGVPQLCRPQDWTGLAVWIDCIAWLRKTLPPQIEEYDMLLGESFFSPVVSLSTAQRIEWIDPLLCIVEPHLKNTDCSPAGENYILISFGGIETPISSDIHRYAVPMMILGALNDAAKKRGDSRKLVCCCPPRIANHLSRDRDLSSIVFTTPNQLQLLQLLRKTSLYIVQPGLYGPFEAFQMGVPTAFTMPFSYTQVCQARAYDKLKLLGNPPLWYDMNNRIRDLEGDVDHEEPACFGEIGAFLTALFAKTDKRNELENWAALALGGNLISSNLIDARAIYASNTNGGRTCHISRISTYLLNEVSS